MTNEAQAATTSIKLPAPRLKSDVSLEEALLNRRSVRAYADSPLTVSEVSQLLWAAQGITDNAEKRTAPSAVAIYPLEIYLVVKKVESLNPGIYQYQPEGHELAVIKDGEVKEALEPYRGAIDIIIAANYEKMTRRFDENTSKKFVFLEGGHAAQNVCLQATVLNLGTVTVGSFREAQVESILGLPDNMGILYVLPVGKKT